MSKRLPRRISVLLLAWGLQAADHRGVVNFGGLPVPGATVVASQGEKRHSTITDQRGGYVLSGLADGVWSVQVEMQCFDPQTREVAMPSEAVHWELQLAPFAPVTASTAAGEVNAETRQEPAKDVKVAEGAQPSEFNETPSEGFLINGSVNNGAASIFAQFPSFGNNRKGPRSLYNGNIGLTLDNSALDARSYSLTGQDTPKPAYNYMQGMLAFGGPLKIPHVINRNGPNLTINYQWIRNRNATTRSSKMPGAAERGGDFSQLGQPVYDPASGAPFAGNVIPRSRISPQAAWLLRFYPLPNFDAGARYNYQAAIVGATHQDNLQSRVNRGVGRKDQLSGSFAYQSTRSDTPNLFEFLDTGSTGGINTAVNWMHHFNRQLFTSLGYQYSRMTTRVNPFFAGRENVSAEAGITGNNQEAVNWGPPSLSFASGLAGLSDGQSSLNRNQTSGVSASLFWGRTPHNFTVGGDFRRQQFNVLSQQDARGTFTFMGASTRGSDFAGFLLGIPDTSAVAFGNADKYLRSSMSDVYFSDDWRARPGLTINWGLRWEYGSPLTERYGRLVNLDIAPGFASVAPLVPAKIKPDRHGLQPRFGLSWRPFLASSVVVRAGYGIYYNTSVYLPMAMQMAQQPPLSKSLAVENSASNPLSLANGFRSAPGTTPNTFAVDPTFRVGYSQNWQVSVQGDLPWSMVMTATYLGIKGTRAPQQFLPNTCPAGAPGTCGGRPTGYAYLTSNGNSTRESGQLQLRRRLHSGLSAQLQYTFSKSIDDAALGGRGQGSITIAQDWLNLRGERGLSNFDQRHLLGVLMQYTTGMGLSGGTLTGGWKGRLFKDWTFASQINAGSGLPLTPVYFAAVRGTGVTGSLRPDYTGMPLYAAPNGLSLNPAAVAAPSPGRWGNAGRNSIAGPSQFSMIATMLRTFRISDRVSADFRIDSANVLNHAVFAGWNTTAGSPQFGLPTLVNPMRSVQTTFRVRF